MANEVTLSQEEFDSSSPPADPAKLEAWHDYQDELALKEANAPGAVFYTTEEVMAGVDVIIRQARERLERKKTAA